MNKLILITALAFSLTGAAYAQGGDDTVVAIINGENVTAADLDRMYANLNPKMRESYEAAGGKVQFLETYVGKKLLIQEAAKRNFDKQPEIAAALADARESALFDLYVRHAIAQNVIPDSVLRQHYERDRKQFEAPPNVKGRHILVTPTEQRVSNTAGDDAKTEEDARKKIAELRTMLLEDPSSFAAYAMRFSEDGSAMRGGDLGWFKPGQMVPEFEAVAFDMKPGEISPVIKTQFGYHLVYIEDVRPARQRTFEEVKGEIRERLLAEYGSDVLEEVNAETMQLRQNSRIQIFSDRVY